MMIPEITTSVNVHRMDDFLSAFHKDDRNGCKEQYAVHQGDCMRGPGGVLPAGFLNMEGDERKQQAQGVAEIVSGIGEQAGGVAFQSYYSLYGNEEQVEGKAKADCLYGCTYAGVGVIMGV